MLVNEEFHLLPLADYIHSKSWSPCEAWTGDNACDSYCFQHSKDQQPNPGEDTQVTT